MRKQELSELSDGQRLFACSHIREEFPSKTVTAAHYYVTKAPSHTEMLDDFAAIGSLSPTAPQEADREHSRSLKPLLKFLTLE